jgi:hypothetical protein
LTGLERELAQALKQDRGGPLGTLRKAALANRWQQRSDVNGY